MNPSNAFKYINELFINYLNSRNKSSSENAQVATTSTNTVNTSNVTLTSAKSKESTTNTPQKRTASQSRDDESIKRLKKTSTNCESGASPTISYHFDNRNGVSVPISSTPDIKPTVTAEKYEGEVNIISLRSSTTATSRNNFDEESSTQSLQDSDQTVNTENVQNQNTNNTGNNLIDDSVMIAGLIPETPKTTTITINEKENDSQVEVSSEGPRVCPICLDSLKDKEVFSTICGHIFCVGCIFTVFETTKECPFCRTSNY